MPPPPRPTLSSRLLDPVRCVLVVSCPRSLVRMTDSQKSRFFQIGILLFGVPALVWLPFGFGQGLRRNALLGAFSVSVVSTIFSVISIPVARAITQREQERRYHEGEPRRGTLDVEAISLLRWHGLPAHAFGGENVGISLHRISRAVARPLPSHRRHGQDAHATFLRQFCS